MTELEAYLEKLAPDGICLAYSGGVDSRLMLAVLMKIRSEKPFAFKALLFSSCFQTRKETREALDFAGNVNAPVTEIRFDPLKIKDVRYNPRNRCYLCKRHLFGKARKIADRAGLKHLIDGTNADDLTVWRPGMKALEETGVLSPFAELGMTKKTIRALSAQMGLDSACKPSDSCLVARFAYGQELTETGLGNVECGEAFLKSLGFSVIRLRRHGEIVRIEIPPEEIPAFIRQRERIVSKLKEIGFVYLTLDLEGFRSGSMDL